MKPARRREILTALAREPAPPPSELRSLLMDVSDWSGLTSHILAHGIEGLALARLMRGDLADLVPEVASERLREAVRAAAVRNLMHRREVVRIVDTLPADAPVLLCKGIALALFVYPRPSMRAMTDVDLFIRPEDVERFEQTLERLGFVREGRSPRPREWWIENFQHLEPFVSPHGGVRVEAHLRNVGEALPYRLAIEPVWRRSLVRSLDGRPVRLMDPADHLAYLILHLYVHHIHLARLRGLVDLDRTIRAAPDLAWDRLVSDARGQGFARLLYLPLRLCASLLATSIPAPVLDATRPPDLDDADLEFLLDYLFREDVGAELVPARMTRALEEGTGRAGFGFARAILFPTNADLCRRYNLRPGSPRVLAVRLVHPFLMAVKWGRFVCGLILGGRQRRLLALTRKVARWAAPGDPSAA